MARLSARDVARRYVEMFGERLENVIASRPEWLAEIATDHENVAAQLFRVLTGDLVVSEQVPQIGAFLRSFPDSHHLFATQVEAAVMRVLSLACVRARYQGFSLTGTLAAIDKIGDTPTPPSA